MKKTVSLLALVFLPVVFSVGIVSLPGCGGSDTPTGMEASEEDEEAEEAGAEEGEDGAEEGEEDDEG